MTNMLYEMLTKLSVLLKIYFKKSLSICLPFFNFIHVVTVHAFNFIFFFVFFFAVACTAKKIAWTLRETHRNAHRNAQGLWTALLGGRRLQQWAGWSHRAAGCSDSITAAERSRMEVAAEESWPVSPTVLWRGRLRDSGESPVNHSPLSHT